MEKQLKKYGVKIESDRPCANLIYIYWNLVMFVEDHGISCVLFMY